MRIVASLGLLALVLPFVGCATVAEHAVDAQVKADARALHQDLCIGEMDYALFRGCLKHRGGSCTGSSTTALPGSTQAHESTEVAPVRPGSSQVLSNAVAALPAGDPAKTAHAVLTHPLLQSLASVYNHIRGLDSPDTDSSSADTHTSSDSSSSGQSTAGQGASCGTHPTLNVGLKALHVPHFHETLLKSIAGTAWESLTGHCEKLLNEQQHDADLPELQNDCRYATFIHDYLAAYLDQGHFIEIQVDATQDIEELTSEVTDMGGRLAALKETVTTVQGLFPAGSSSPLTTSTAVQISNQAALLAASVDLEVRRDVPDLVVGFLASQGNPLNQQIDETFIEVEAASRIVSVLAESLQQHNLSLTVDGLKQAVTELNTKLGDLQTLIGTSADVDNTNTAVGQLSTALNTGAQSVNAHLSNMAHIPGVGFVSRDQQFQAQLPTFKVTYEPPSLHLRSSDSGGGSGGSSDLGQLTVTDIQTGSAVTKTTDLNDLGIVSDSSGVDTGTRISSELTRVFLEALYDAHEGLPAFNLGTVNGQAVSVATGTTLPADYALQVFQTSDSISSTDITQMTKFNTRLAVTTRQLVSRLASAIPGDYMHAEETLTELMTTSVRKAAEKATWCWYACDLDQVVKKTEVDAQKEAKDEVEGELHKIKSDLHEDLEHVLIRFRINP